MAQWCESCPPEFKLLVAHFRFRHQPATHTRPWHTPISYHPFTPHWVMALGRARSAARTQIKTVWRYFPHPRLRPRHRPGSCAAPEWRDNQRRSAIFHTHFARICSTSFLLRSHPCVLPASLSRSIRVLFIAPMFRLQFLPCFQLAFFSPLVCFIELSALSLVCLGWNW